MLADHREGVEWVAARCVQTLDRWGGRQLVEQTGTASFLLPLLGSSPVEPVSRRFYAAACSALDAAVKARTIRHGNQSQLNGAVALARWSVSGDADQRVLSRKDPQVSPLVAATLALHGLTLQPANAGGWMVSLP